MSIKLSIKFSAVVVWRDLVYVLRLGIIVAFEVRPVPSFAESRLQARMVRSCLSSFHF